MTKTTQNILRSNSEPDFLAFYASCFVARGGHLARVRCLSDGTCTAMADHLIRRAVEDDVLGEWLPMPPSIPKSERWRFRRARTRRGTHIDLGRAA